MTGSRKLLDGLTLIAGGVQRLADAQTGVPAAKAGAEKLLAGVDRIRAGISNPKCDPTNPQDPDNPCGLLEGLQAVRTGLNRTDAQNPGLILGATMLEGGLQQLLSADPQKPGLPVAKGGVDQVHAAVSGALTPSTGSVAQLAGGIDNLKKYCTDTTTAVACNTDIGQLVYGVNSANDADGVESLREKLAAADAGLTQVSAGLGNAISGVTSLRDGATRLKGGLGQAEAGVSSLIGGVGLIQAGLSNPLCDRKNPTDPKNPCGLHEGLESLVAGMTEAATGLTQQLAPGTTQAVDGASALADKLAFAGAGAGSSLTAWFERTPVPVSLPTAPTRQPTAGTSWLPGWAS